MKGGTALNLFVQDLPRLSVDIDVVFIDYTVGREEALQAIGEDLLASKSLISKMGHRTSLPTNKSGDDVKPLVEAPDARVKVEVNFVFRGTVLPTVRARLCDRAQHVFTTDIEVPMLETAELYGSKLVAAMDRQHPRDMFDVMRMREQGELDGSIIDCFAAYLGLDEIAGLLGHKTISRSRRSTPSTRRTIMSSVTKAIDAYFRELSPLLDEPLFPVNLEEQPRRKNFLLPTSRCSGSHSQVTRYRPKWQRHLLRMPRQMDCALVTDRSSRKMLI